jgi:hypothetical protein
MTCGYLHRIAWRKVSVLLCVSLPTTNARMYQYARARRNTSERTTLIPGASGEQFQAVSETSPSALTRDLAWDLLHTDIRFAIPSSSPPACTIKSSSPTPAVSPGHSCASSTAGAPANDPKDVEPLVLAASDSSPAVCPHRRRPRSRDIRCAIPVVRPAIILLPPADISRSDFQSCLFSQRA